MDERFIECFGRRFVVFELNKFMVVVSCSLVVDPATAGLKEGGKRREMAFRTQPQVQTLWNGEKL
jgi:hypothetical protein